MNNDINNNQESNNQNSLEPEVIGELRKRKIGDPKVVIELIVVFAIVLIALPLITNMLNDENSTLYKFVNKNKIDNNVDNPVVKEEFSNGANLQTLNSATKMKYENIVLQNFSLAKNTLTFNIYSYNGILNLDKKALFLEIYTSGNDTVLDVVKLIGTYDSTSKNISYTLKNNYNSTYSYVGKIVEMKENDYPKITISTDETGIGSFICKNTNREIEYTFKNNYLISIKDTVNYSTSSSADSTEYVNTRSNYENKANALGGSVENTYSGFRFTVNINLEEMSIPESVIDYDYYALDTDAYLIHYTEEAKGYDCE